MCVCVLVICFFSTLFIFWVLESTSGHSNVFTPYILLLFHSAVLGGGSKDDCISFISRNTSILIFKEVRRRLMTFAMDSSFAWVQDLCSFLFSGRSSDRRLASSENVLEMVHLALDILSGSFFCLNTIDAEIELVQDILAAIFIIDWEFSWIDVSDDKLDKEHVGKIEARLSSCESFHAFRYKMGDQLLKGFDINNRKSLGANLIQSIKCITFIDNSFDSDNFITSCCQWAVDVFEFFCHDQVEQQQLLEQFLSKNDSWPLWVVPDSAGVKLRADDISLQVSCIVFCFSSLFIKKCAQEPPSSTYPVSTY